MATLDQNFCEVLHTLSSFFSPDGTDLGAEIVAG
jgi:hypothetical protein